MVAPWKSLLGWLSVSISPKTERDATVKQFYTYRLDSKVDELCLAKAQTASSSHYLRAIFSMCFKVEEINFHVTSTKKSAALQKNLLIYYTLHVMDIVMFFNRKGEY